MTDQTLWVGTDALIDAAGYQPVVHVGDDLSIELAGDRATRYACAVLSAAMRAAYDAAIIEQWVRGLKGDQEVIYTVLARDLQPDRPPLDTEATAPIVFEPAIVKNRDTGRHRGVLRIRIPTGDLGMFEISDAREHAIAVLTTALVADLDSGYLRFLQTTDLDGARCRATINDVGLWLDAGDTEATSHRLARDLREAGVPGEIVDRARDGVYDDYRSDLDLPTAQLVTDLAGLGRTDLVDRAMAGEWDGSQAEAGRWFQSREGQETTAMFHAFIRAAEGLCGEQHQHTAACVPGGTPPPPAAAGQPPKPGGRQRKKPKRRKR